MLCRNPTRHAGQRLKSHECAVQLAPTVSTVPAHPSPLLTIADTLTVHLSPRPQKEDLIELAQASRATEKDVKRLLAKEKGYHATLLYNDAMPCVHAISSLGTRAVGFSAFECDYAFTAAVRSTMPVGAGFPLYGGPLGLGLLPVCRDGVVLARRPSTVDWAKGALRAPSEGVEMSDLEGHGEQRTLSVATLAARLCAEELGPEFATAHIQPIGLCCVPGELAIMVVGYVECSFADVVKSLALAPDGAEHELVLFSSAATALAAMGSDQGNATALLLKEVIRRALA